MLIYNYFPIFFRLHCLLFYLFISFLNLYYDLLFLYIYVYILCLDLFICMH